MIFYKITHNQDIIDVNTNESINYVRYDRYHQSLKICGSDSSDIIGIVSSDNSAIYHCVNINIYNRLIMSNLIKHNITSNLLKILSDDSNSSPSLTLIFILRRELF